MRRKFVCRAFTFEEASLYRATDLATSEASSNLAVCSHSENQEKEQGSFSSVAVRIGGWGMFSGRFVDLFGTFEVR